MLFHQLKVLVSLKQNQLKLLYFMIQYQMVSNQFYNKLEYHHNIQNIQIIQLKLRFFLIIMVYYNLKKLYYKKNLWKKLKFQLKNLNKLNHQNQQNNLNQLREQNKNQLKEQNRNQLNHNKQQNHLNQKNHNLKLNKRKKQSKLK